MTIISHEVVVKPLGSHKLKRKEANLKSMTQKAAEHTNYKEQTRMGIFPKQLFCLKESTASGVSEFKETHGISWFTTSLRRRNLDREALRSKDYSPFRASQNRYLHLKTKIDQNITASLLENSKCPLYSSFSQSRIFDVAPLFPELTKISRRAATPNPSSQPVFSVQDIRIATPEPMRHKIIPPIQLEDSVIRVR